MRLLFPVLFISFFFLFGCSGSQRKREIESRVEKILQEDWYFIADTSRTGVKNKWYDPLNVPEDTVRIRIPHTWNVVRGLEEHFGPGWYYRNIKVPDDWEGKTIRIKFDAVYRDADIWLNGKKLLERRGNGYTPFEVDLTGHLIAGINNLLVVEASNEFSIHAIPYDHKFDWANDGGIIRNVWLVKTETPYIKSVAVDPELTGGGGELTAKIRIGGHKKSGSGMLDVWWEISEYNQPTQAIVDRGNRQLKINNDEIILKRTFGGIKPWHFDVPYLYRIKIAIGNEMVLTDHSSLTFGFRSLEVHGDRILFNDEPVRLPGIEWMPGSSPDQGMGEDTASMARMLLLLKNTGAVVTRFHWQQDDFIYSWCDENGILVQEEIPLWQAPYPDQLNEWNRELAYEQARDMIEAHRNHPSIISWGIGNELMAQNDTIKNFLRDLKSRIKAIDPSRPVNYVSNTFHQNPVNDGTATGDILMWNDYSGLWYNMDGNGITLADLPELLDKFNRQVPDKPMIISEYGLCEPVFKGGDPARIEHFLNHTAAYDDRKFIGGIIYFSLNDYRTHMGEEGKGKFRQRVHGIVDLNGNKKPSYNVVRDRFSPILDLNGETINGNIHVTGRNRNGIPSYTLIFYKVRFYGDDNVLLDEEMMPPVPPGEAFNIVFRNPEQPVKEVKVLSQKDFLKNTITINP